MRIDCSKLVTETAIYLKLRHDMTFEDTGPLELHDSLANVLMMHIRAPGMPRRGEGNIRHVKAGDYFHHALYPFGLARIYAFNIAVRNC